MPCLTEELINLLEKLFTSRYFILPFFQHLSTFQTHIHVGQKLTTSVEKADGITANWPAHPVASPVQSTTGMWNMSANSATSTESVEYVLPCTAVGFIILPGLKSRFHSPLLLEAKYLPSSPLLQEKAVK
ncbi:MAG: hypothetical protein H7330_08555 [Hymenobacteraceae bacterium]|nr:hypothetical protein [Hymenobacteraceae bacterium]